mmetsp:Transcript_20395/g.33585  ORF Transcript_20395/g.33585 Transcript_20395/m.33585 type:complete len:561 (+) Transcript_20395:145-1827(+)
MKSNNINNQQSSGNDLRIFPSSLDKQERSASTESTISTGHIKHILLSPITACKSPSSVTEMNIVKHGWCTPPHSAPSSPPSSPKHKKSSQQSRVGTSYEAQQHHNGRKKAVYRNRTSPPHYSKKSIPKTRSTPSLSSSHDSYGEELCKGQTSSAAAALLNGENLLDKAALDPCNSWCDAESTYSYSSQDQLLDHNCQVSRQLQSCSSYDCNYKYTQEAAYEDFGVERKLIDKINKGQSSSAQESAEMRGHKQKKKKHWIRLRQSISAQSQAITLPKKPSFTGLKKASSLGSERTLPPSGKSSNQKRCQPAVRTGSAPPTYFQVDIRDAPHSSSSVGGYYSAPIETELRPDRSLSQMGMEVSEEDYCIEGEYMARHFQQHQEYSLSGCCNNQRKGDNKKLRESVFSMKELAKGLEGLSTRKSRSPKVLKTKVLSALRKGSNSDTATKDASDKKKKIPHQIAIAVTPSTSEDTGGDDHLSLYDMQLLYKWQNARCRREFNHFSSSRSRGGVVSCSTDGDCTQVETAISKKMSEDVMSITSSVGDRTVSVDNRRCSVKRQVSF